ncbi:MAG: APC family permease [Armatimonadia bacterium]
MPYSLRRLFVGNPLPTSRMTEERIGPLVGLSVFSADALSSVAYGTEEVLLALALAGTTGLQVSIYPAIAIAVLICIVAFSYRQTILAYPDGGGAYIVAKENLGVLAGLIAGGALLVDYVLTVAVSVTSGVAAVISAFPFLLEYRVVMAVLVIAFVAFVNLRGTRESGFFFAIPTYVFIVSILALIGAGLLRSTHPPVPNVMNPNWLPAVPAPLTTFLILRAFASGCAALTGIEAVANGVQAFRKPAAHNAVKVMVALASLLFVMFIGISWLAHIYHITPDPHAKVTVVSQIAEAVFGRGAFYLIIQCATAVILFLAANTSFAGFPRLVSLLARDGYVPRQLSNLGDRLVFTNGIILLGAAAITLVIIFGGLTHALIPLYAVGVFLAFTLSQTGMVVRWLRLRTTGWHMNIAINAVGAATTFTVLGVILMVKFVAGAWMVAIFLPVMVYEFMSIKKHYAGVADLLRIDKIEKLPVHPTRVIIPIAGLHRGVLRALRFALGLNCPTEALHVAINEEAADKLRKQWAKLQVSVPLVILDSPYRSLVGPVLDYVDEALEKEPEAFVAVVIPEFVPQHWRHALLHNQSALLLEFALRSRPNAVLISIRYFLSRAAESAKAERAEIARHEAEALGAPESSEKPEPMALQAATAPPPPDTIPGDVDHEPPPVTASPPAPEPQPESPTRPPTKPAAPPAAPPG